MDEYLLLIALCKKLKRNSKNTGRIFTRFEFKEAVLLSEQLNVISIYEESEVTEVQLDCVTRLKQFNCEIKIADASDSISNYVEHSVEVDGIKFFALKNMSKEEHKKTQAI